MHQYLISFLIFTPLCAVVLILVTPVTFSKAYRSVTLLTNLVQCLIVGVISANFSNTSELQFIEHVSWIRLDLGSWGILSADYFVALDGLNLPLVSLSVAVLTIATLASWKTEKYRQGYFSLLLIMNAAIIGTFVAFDLLLFYLFFEFMLLPMFFLIGIWGGPRREYASIKFFLYTLLGSILILIVFIGLYLSYSSGEGEQLIRNFNLQNFIDQKNIIEGSLLQKDQPLIGSLTITEIAFLFLVIGFTIKLPVVPFHTWLPDAHVEASTPVSVILAAILLKVGGYGLLRIACPIFPEAFIEFSWLLALFGVISIIYGAFNALGSKDLKKLIAYSSVSHMGFVTLGIASATAEGVAGAVYQMFSHGILSAMLFIAAGVIYDRSGDRLISNYSGLYSAMPKFFVFVLIAFFASLGLPGFSGFIAEIFVLIGAFKSPGENGLLHLAFGVVATFGLVLSAGYFLWTIQRMFFGKLNYHGDVRLLKDIRQIEVLQLTPLAISALIFGVLPQLLLNWINPFAMHFVDLIFRK
ncbi:MAG TPA: NADH-quinone oxidoreductase subunit M [Chryseosolibacter sp.]|nr:NADH-quinone oxidoreductase subunit M [Chryseosolibacter sp.]